MRLAFHLTLGLALAVQAGALHAQTTISRRTITARRTAQPVVIDGVHDDVAWTNADRQDGFNQHFPFDTSGALARTEIMLAYDDAHLYVAAIVHDTVSGPYVSTSLRRDYRGPSSDGFTIILEPFRDRTNGVFFGVNPFNVQREGLVVNGGNEQQDFDLSWDNIWYTATKIGDGYWSLEMAIPFKTLRFRAGLDTWGVNFYRLDSKVNERSIWNRVPRQFSLYNLAYAGELHWEEPLESAGSNISVIPYTTADASRNYLAGTPGQRGAAAGADAKIAVTPALNLDVTVNPDFSQVEVDAQQTNLDRFELFFPERRQFFLENADLFANFGFTNARPFFSRRIGVAIDSATGQNVQDRIVGGVRLSGKLDDQWRVGLMSMQTARDDGIGASPRNYAVAALQRKLFTRSNIGLIAVNQQTTDGGVLDPRRPNDADAARLLGLEYNLASATGAWTGKLFQHHSFREGAEGAAYSHGGQLAYTTLRYSATWLHQVVSRGFDARTGFVPRTDFRRANPVLTYSLFPENSRVNRHQFVLSNNLIGNDTWGLTDYNLFAQWTAELQNTGRFAITAVNDYVQLFAPFSPLANPAQRFEAGDRFTQPAARVAYQSDLRPAYTWTASVQSGRFFNGTRTQLAGTFNYRYRQYANAALAYEVNRINLGDGFDDATVYLVGPRFDLTLTNSLFWTTFTQYNSQFDNLNINSRLQWRFRPVSDFFLVYTDNYFPNSFQVKNRALVMKMSWWVNM